MCGTKHRIESAFYRPPKLGVAGIEPQIFRGPRQSEVPKNILKVLVSIGADVLCKHTEGWD
jgi:hypothetical protein